MTDKEVELDVGVENSAALANEWVEHLKKQSKLRLAMLSIASVGLLASTGMWISTSMDKSALELELSARSALISELQSDVAQKADAIPDLSGKLTSTQNRASFLEQVKGDTASQLSVAEQIIDTQKQKIDLIEQEYESSTQLVAQLEEQLQEAKGRAATLQNTLNSKEKALSQRSAAYNAIVKRQKDTRAEVDRLAVALEKAEAAETATRQRLASVQGKLSKSNTELARLRTELGELHQELLARSESEAKPEQVSQNQHDLAIQPIIGQASVEDSGTNVLKGNQKVVDPNALMIE